MSDVFQQLGKTIRQTRKQRGWTQQQLAQHAGLDRMTIGALERGLPQDLGIRKVQRVLAALQLSLAVRQALPPTLDELQQESWE
ncbi:helix-turn-helix domain-containing protein [Chromatiaceae bacterium AAb-1]|nr:helix-turn-helix domain-containing protein [Chromatiaceae bacterium AAb-1]